MIEKKIMEMYSYLNDIAFLLEHRGGEVTTIKEGVGASIGNTQKEEDIMALLRDQLAKEVVISAAKGGGEALMDFLWYQGCGVNIPEDLVEAIGRNKWGAARVIAHFLKPQHISVISIKHVIAGMVLLQKLG